MKTHSFAGILSWLLAAAFVMLSVPLAFAAPALNFTATPDEGYKVYEGGTYDVGVELTGYVEDTTVDFYIHGPIDEPEEALKLIDSHTFITNGTHTFSWDGLFDGAYPLAGDYEVRLRGEDLFANMTNVLTHNFTVTEEAHITIQNAPENYSTDDPNDYEIDFDLETAVPACIVLQVGEEAVSSEGPLSTGTHTIAWNGELGGDTAADDDYKWRMYADSGECGGDADTDELAAGTVTVGDLPEPEELAISNLGVTIDPFSPDGDENQDTTTVSFNLSHDADVTVTVLDADEVEIRTLINEEATSAGSVNVVWDGEDTGGSMVADGTYTVMVTAESGEETVADEVEVEVDTSTEEEEGCGGYSDVPENHPDCAAIEYVQSIGAMTGHPDGTFRMNEILQRDQIAKISLETFGLFDAEVDYCDGDEPFPDVPFSAWSVQYICRGVDLDMITGYQSGADAGLYVPARSVNRVEFLALILRNLDDSMPGNDSTSYNDVAAGQWFSGYAKYSYDNSLFVGNNLNPTQLVTRGEVAGVLYKLDQLGKI